MLVVLGAEVGPVLDAGDVKGEHGETLDDAAGAVDAEAVDGVEGVDVVAEGAAHVQVGVGDDEAGTADEAG